MTLTGRATALLLTAVIGVAFVGFVVGTVGSGRAPVETAGLERAPERVTPTAAPEGVQPALSYEQVGRIGLGPNRDWRTRLASLPRPPEPDPNATITIDPKDKLASLRDRESRRAYNGAPPVVPHTVDQLSTASCLACHAESIAVGRVRAGRIPHPALTNCTQCHVESRSAALLPFTLAANGFAGKPAPTEGPRAWPGAPPVIPHSTLMRTDCLSCHGPVGPPGMQTTHPERRSCLQCHAPSAALDQYAPE